MCHYYLQHSFSFILALYSNVISISKEQRPYERNTLIKLQRGVGKRKTPTVEDNERREIVQRNFMISSYWKLKKTYGIRSNRYMIHISC